MSSGRPRWPPNGYVARPHVPAPNDEAAESEWGLDPDFRDDASWCAQRGYRYTDLVPVTLPNSGLLIIALLRSSVSTIKGLFQVPGIRPPKRWQRPHPPGLFGASFSTFQRSPSPSRSDSATPLHDRAQRSRRSCHWRRSNRDRNGPRTAITTQAAPFTSEPRSPRRGRSRFCGI
jgi:hypothetical protein